MGETQSVQSRNSELIFLHHLEKKISLYKLRNNLEGIIACFKTYHYNNSEEGMASGANSFPGFFPSYQIYGFEQDKQLNLIRFQNIFKIYIEWNSNNLKQEIKKRNRYNQYFLEKSIWYALQSFAQILEIYHTHKLAPGKINTIYVQIKPNDQICLFDTKIIQNSQTQYYKNYIDYARPISYDLKVKNSNDYMFKIGLCLVEMVTLVDPSQIYFECKNSIQFQEKIKMHLQSVKYKYSQKLIQLIQQMINKQSYTHNQLKSIKKISMPLSGNRIELLRVNDSTTKRERIYSQNSQLKKSNLRCIYVVSSEGKQKKNQAIKDKLKEISLKNKNILQKQHIKENGQWPKTILKETLKQNGCSKTLEEQNREKSKNKIVVTSLNIIGLNENSFKNNSLNVSRQISNGVHLENRRIEQISCMKNSNNSNSFCNVNNNLQQFNYNISKNNTERYSISNNFFFHNDKHNNNKSSLNIPKPFKQNQFLCHYNKLKQDLQSNKARPFVSSKKLQNIQINQNVTFQKKNDNFDQSFTQISSNPHFIEKQLININKVNFQRNSQIIDTQKQNFEKSNYCWKNDSEKYSLDKKNYVKNQPYMKGSLNLPKQRLKVTQFFWDRSRKINNNPYLKQKKLIGEKNRILEGRVNILDIMNYKSLQKFN